MTDPRTLEALARYRDTLVGRVALVTGAGSGIGRAAAVALATAGAEVALVGRRPGPLDDTAALVTGSGGRALAIPADVTEPASMATAVARVRDSLGAPDIVVAAAGVNAWADLADLDPEQLRAALATNVEGVANAVRATVPAMRERGGGKVIVVASDNGRRAEAGGSGYVASKFGAVGFALAISLELAAAGIGVHVIEPGCVDTPWYPADEDAPRERMLSPDDVALAVLFLATLPAHIVLDELMILPRGLLVDPWA